jgi:hypothetical protein
MLSQLPMTALSNSFAGGVRHLRPSLSFNGNFTPLF